MPRGKKQPVNSDPPAKKGKYAPSESGEVEWGGYINIRVDADTKQKYEAWIAGEPLLFWAMLEDTVCEGMKYGLTWDESNNCYIATFTGNGMLGFNVRCCLSARSDRFEDATALLVFKHSIICEGNWGNFRPRTGMVDNWG